MPEDLHRRVLGSIVTGKPAALLATFPVGISDFIVGLGILRFNQDRCLSLWELQFMTKGWGITRLSAVALLGACGALAQTAAKPADAKRQGAPATAPAPAKASGIMV